MFKIELIVCIKMNLAFYNLQRLIFLKTQPTNQYIMFCFDIFIMSLYTYGHFPLTSQTIQVRWTRYAWQCWKILNEPISDILLCTPTYGHASVCHLVRTYVDQLCVDTGCLEDLWGVMDIWVWEWESPVSLCYQWIGKILLWCVFVFLFKKKRIGD